MAANNEDQTKYSQKYWEMSKKNPYINLLQGDAGGRESVLQGEQ
jgi:hypothetical protein